MKRISVVFHAHEPIRLRNFRFFETGSYAAYFDEESLETRMRKLNKNLYFPLGNFLLKKFQETQHAFKISVSLSGMMLDFLDKKSSESIRLLKELNHHGGVEFLAESYSHSVYARTNEQEFLTQVMAQSKKIKHHFGQVPQVFFNINGQHPFQVFKNSQSLGIKHMLQPFPIDLLGHHEPFATYKSMDFKGGICFAHDLFDLKYLQGSSKAILNGARKFVSWVASQSDADEFYCIYLDMNRLSDAKVVANVKVFLNELIQAAEDYGVGFVTPTEYFSSCQSEKKAISWKAVKESAQEDILCPMQQELLELFAKIQQKVYQTNNSALLKNWFYIQDQVNFNLFDQATDPLVEKNELVQHYIALRNILEDIQAKCELLGKMGNAAPEYPILSVQAVPSSALKGISNNSTWMLY
ncbi:hypothetical protein [Mongoliitalea daihaiensis]|uniref:hypothetical protein n=1 Tax=Mongoliitalea daihaiensis TaxID=2782006 RepID=UPI001F32D7F9|nr:hypothetical protein [Mongoliitalea daihaiensis]UJP65413.1 hypothetical protein IPZ59_01960 [Mongoliitalea daihaiensis]